MKFCWVAIILAFGFSEVSGHTSVEKTLSIIKPDAVEKNCIGVILERLEREGLRPVAMRMKQLTREEVGQLYAIHRERPFYHDLVDFMISGPVVVMALEGENAVSCYREVMGATDPVEAVPGTIRADFADSIDANAVHGSEDLEAARRELAFFFQEDELRE